MGPPPRLPVAFLALADFFFLAAFFLALPFAGSVSVAVGWAFSSAIYAPNATPTRVGEDRKVLLSVFLLPGTSPNLAENLVFWMYRQVFDERSIPDGGREDSRSHRPALS